MDESALPLPLREALEYLRSNGMPDVHVDALSDNFAYVWLPTIAFGAEKYPEPHRRGLWVRIPVQFPLVNPHGIVTKGRLDPIVAHAIKGESQDPNMIRPVQDLGGTFYYSWTWSGELGEGPRLEGSSDIAGVVSWVERRIRTA